MGLIAADMTPVSVCFITLDGGGTWGTGEFTELRLNLYDERKTLCDDLKEAIRIVETVEQMLYGQRYGV